MIKIAARIFVILLFGASATARTKADAGPDLSKPYWLRYSLAFFPKRTPVVSPHNIVFAEENAPFHDGSGGIEARGTKVKIYSVRKEDGYTRVVFRLWPEMYESSVDYEVLLKSDARSSFRKSFALLFSGEKVPRELSCGSYPKTREQVIRCLGFPMLVRRDGDAEEFDYRLGFVISTFFSGYDALTIKMKNGKVITVGGIV